MLNISLLMSLTTFLTVDFNPNSVVLQLIESILVICHCRMLYYLPNKIILGSCCKYLADKLKVSQFTLVPLQPLPRIHHCDWFSRLHTDIYSK